MNQVRSKLNSGGWVDSSSWFSRCFQSLSQNVVRELSRQMVLPFGWESVTSADETCGREGALFLVMGSRAWHMFKSSHRRQIGGSWSHERHENSMPLLVQFSQGPGWKWFSHVVEVIWFGHPNKVAENYWLVVSDIFPSIPGRVIPNDPYFSIWLGRGATIQKNKRVYHVYQSLLMANGF